MEINAVKDFNNFNQNGFDDLLVRLDSTNHSFPYVGKKVNIAVKSDFYVNLHIKTRQEVI